MSNLHLVSLSDEAVREAATNNYPLWGGGRTLEQHISRVFEGKRRLGVNYMGLCESGGRLIGALKLYEIALRLEGRIVPALGIGAVHVPESARGKGYGKEIVKRSMAYAASKGALAMLLFSDIDPRFYEELGFARLSALDWRADPSSLPSAEPYALRQAAPNELDLLIAWHERAAGRYAVTVARSSASWRGFRWFRGASEDLILTDRGVDAGYVTIDASEKTLEIVEGWASDRDRYWATIRRVAMESGHDELFGWASSGPHEPWMKIQERSTAIPMVAPLDGSRLVVPASSWFSSADHF